MRKSERNKVKLRVIQRIESFLAADKGNLRLNWIDSHRDSYFPVIRAAYRVAVKDNIRNIRGDLFALRAIKKQMPMPVKMQVGACEDMGYFYGVANRVSKCSYKAICQNCNHTLEAGIKYFGVTTITINQTKYCPFCGQKLWWPKN